MRLGTIMPVFPGYLLQLDVWLALWLISLINSNCLKLIWKRRMGCGAGSKGRNPETPGQCPAVPWTSRVKDRAQNFLIHSSQIQQALETKSSGNSLGSKADLNWRHLAIKPDMLWGYLLFWFIHTYCCRKKNAFGYWVLAPDFPRVSYNVWFMHCMDLLKKRKKKNLILEAHPVPRVLAGKPWHEWQRPSHSSQPRKVRKRAQSHTRTGILQSVCFVFEPSPWFHSISEGTRPKPAEIPCPCPCQEPVQTGGKTSRRSEPQRVWQVLLEIVTTPSHPPNTF